MKPIQQPEALARERIDEMLVAAGWVMEASTGLLRFVQLSQ